MESIPFSQNVGTSGTSGCRLSIMTARSGAWPHFTGARKPPTLSNISSTRLPNTAAMAWGEPCVWMMLTSEIV